MPKRQKKKNIAPVPDETVRNKSQSMADNFLESIPEFNLLYYFRTETVSLSETLFEI